MQQNAYLCATKATQKIYCIKNHDHLLAKVGGFLGKTNATRCANFII